MKIARFLFLLKRKIASWTNKTRPALSNLDKKLEKYLNFDNGFFIEAGAHDGYSQSNTYYLEKERNWRGLLVEGIPELMQQCQRNRPNAIVQNYALVASDYPNSTIKMHYVDFMSIVEGAHKTPLKQETHIREGTQTHRLNDAYEIKVPAKTLASILDEIDNLPQIDFFSLDVEGYEIQVLKGLNLSKYRPKYILVEAWYFEDMKAFLESYDYELIEYMSDWDYLYKDKNVP